MGTNWRERLRRLSLHNRQWVVCAILIVTIVLAVAGEVEKIGLLKVLGVAGIIVGLIADVRLLRCPHCDTWLGRYPGKHCGNCGAEIRWKEPLR